MELKNSIEAIMFALGRKITTVELVQALNIPIDEVTQAMDELEQEYTKKDCGISMVRIEDGYQLVSNKKYFGMVAKFVTSTKCEKLTDTMLEVLSIIAYNSNISKGQIEQIRGINSDSQVAKLLEFGLIEEVGRLKTIGKPIIFSTTEEFLRNMGLTKLEELPDYENIKKANELQKEENHAS